MDDESHPQHGGSIQTADDQKGQSTRRPYEKPRLEPHDISIAILGNGSPVSADGLSGSFRS